MWGHLSDSLVETGSCRRTMTGSEPKPQSTVVEVIRNDYFNVLSLKVDLLNHRGT